MKKVIKLAIIGTILLGLASCGSKTKEEHKFGVCKTKTDALNMMSAVQVYGGKLAANYMDTKNLYSKTYDEYNNGKLKDIKKLKKLNKQQYEASQKWSNYVGEIGAVGKIINDGKYQEACDKYIAISKKYGGNIEEDYKNSYRVDGAKKDKKFNFEKCSAPEASAVYMTFIKKIPNKKSDDKDILELNKIATTLMLTKPNKVCKKIKDISNKFDLSYKDIVSSAKETVERNTRMSKHEADIKNKNAHLNKNCNQEDMIKLAYKQEDMSKKFLKLFEQWKERENEINNAKLKNLKLEKIVRNKADEVSKISSKMYDEYEKKIKNGASRVGKYDLACKLYKELEEKYNKILKEEQKEYDEFNPDEALKNSKEGKKIYTSNSEVEKYNNIVNIINYATPNFVDKFNLYATECGTDKNKRVHARVEMAIKTFGAQNREVYEKQYGYHFPRKFDQYRMDKILNIYDAVLANKSYPEADKIVKEYKEVAKNYMKLYNEAAEYYNMKDYKDDNFKKADELHKPVIEAYERIIKYDSQLRDMLNKIIDKRTLAQIEHYKKTNQMLFYYVTKAQYLSKKLYEYASHKKDYKTLDTKALRAKIDELRDFYNEFNKYKSEHKTLFNDNPQFKEYLNKFHEYNLVVKEFYVKLKDKDSNDAEEDFLKHIPQVARNSIEANREGSPVRLLKHYNALVKYYNSLNM